MPSKEIHADHIKPLALLIIEHNITTVDQAAISPELWDISNGQTLCIPCHKQTDSFLHNYNKNYNKDGTPKA